MTQRYSLLLVANMYISRRVCLCKVDALSELFKQDDDSAGQHEANTREGLEAVWTHISPYPKKVIFQARA